MAVVNGARLWGGCACVLMFGAAANETGAQTAPAQTSTLQARAAQSPEPILNDGDIIVTARRRAETAQNTPVPMTVLNEALLDRYAIKGIATIAQLTPGLITGESSGSVGGSISLRGIGSGESQPFIDQVVSVNVDGVQISSAQILRAAQLDLKQIEVLRGPQALFFGKNSPGGVISLTSADPGDTLEVIARAGYEFKAEEKYAELTVSGPITDTLGVRLSGHYSRMNGYIKIISPSPPAGIDPYDLNAFPKQNEGFIRGTVVFKPSDRLTLRLKGTYAQTDIIGSPSYYTDVTACPYGTPQETPVRNNCRNDGIVYTSLLPAAYLPISPLNLNDRHGARHNKQTLLTGTIDYKLADDIALTSITGYYGVRERLMSNGSYSVNPNYAFAVPFSTSQISEEVRLVSSFDTPLNFVVGGLFEDRRLYTATQLGVPTLLTNLFTQESTHQKQTTYSGFGQLLWNIVPKVQVTAGGRYTHEVKRLLDYTVSSATVPLVDVTKLPTYPGGPDPELIFNNFSPEATVTYKPIDDVMLFASYKRGFKSGGFDAGYTAGAILSPTRQAQGQTFKPEKVQGFEGGLKTTLLDRQLTFNLTGYLYDYRDLQVAVFDTTIHAFRTQNAAKARIKGLELETSFRPRGVPGLNLHATGAYNQAKFVDYLGDCYAGQSQALGCNLVLNSVTGRYTSQDLSGRHLRKAPVFSGVVGGYYETPVTSALSASASVDMAYSDGYNASTNYNPYAYQPSFTKVDATLRLFTPTKQWELALIGRNLTSERNLINANDRNGTGGLKGGTATCATIASVGCDKLPDITGTPTLPRSVTVQLTYRY